MKYYDRENNRLVYIQEKASPEFWDKLWEAHSSHNLRDEITSKRRDFLIVPTTKKYLKEGSKIIEGGCGKGQYVYSLQVNRFNCVGVDFAFETIKEVKKAVPELSIVYGDVRRLNFKDNTFDGYWSLGVIEHFFEGYDSISNEIKRVLRPKGFLFLAFPYISPIRRIKAKLNMYPQYIFKYEPINFFQFALDHKRVIKRFQGSGFRLIKKKPFLGFMGLKEEIACLRHALNFITNYQNRSIFVLGLKLLISKIFAPLSGQSILLVLQKQ